MARKCEAIFDASIECLQTRDEAKIDQVRSMDREIDQMELAADRLSMETLALRDPYALDFRYVFSVVKIIHELERVGDQAKTVAKWSRRLPQPAGGELMSLAEKTREALRESIQALVDQDTVRADRVMQLEFDIDELEDRIIESSPSLAEAFIAKAIERIGDLATNIAESVVFTVNASDIRHGHFQSRP
ncbi:MAG: hypothetical protein K1X75_14125 [Leptospirales bacterium]|nr:hypothetical protein [Leptospirales bacterium]